MVGDGRSGRRKVIFMTNQLLLFQALIFKYIFIYSFKLLKSFSQYIIIISASVITSDVEDT